MGLGPGSIRPMRAIFGLTAVAFVLSPFVVGAVIGQEEAQRDEVVQALYDLVDRDPFVQKPAARFLGARGDLDAVPFMVALLHLMS